MRRTRLRAGLAGCLLAALAVPLGLIGFGAIADEADTPPAVPLGLPPVFWPEDNDYSKAKSDLGRLLYFDTRLSSNHTVSCASCHAPEKAFTDNLPVSVGIGGQKGGRNAPTVINRAYSTAQFWDGRAASLEEQAKGPIANPVEMTAEKDADAAHQTVVAGLREVAGYLPLFQKAFAEIKAPGDITIDHIAKAIATYERTVYSGNAPYDRYKAGDKDAMTAAQVRGMELFFGAAACDSCHLGFNFTDGSYENIGIGMDKPNPDLGRYVVTKREDEKGGFKTPTLRDIEHTGPYMHDGSLATLEEVMAHYNKGGTPNPWLDERIKPLELEPEELADLVAFMKALSGEGWQSHKAPAAEEFPK